MWYTRGTGYSSLGASPPTGSWDCRWLLRPGRASGLGSQLSDLKSGISGAHKVAILEKGVKGERVGQAPRSLTMRAD